MKKSVSIFQIMLFLWAFLFVNTFVFADEEEQATQIQQAVLEYLKNDYRVKDNIMEFKEYNPDEHKKTEQIQKRLLGLLDSVPNSYPNKDIILHNLTSFYRDSVYFYKIQGDHRLRLVDQLIAKGNTEEAEKLRQQAEEDFKKAEDLTDMIVEIKNNLFTNFPDYIDKDEVLLDLVYLLTDQGQFQKSLEHGHVFIKEFPQSLRIDEAVLVMANNYCYQSDYEEANAIYKAFPDKYMLSSIIPLALYQFGECLIRQENYTDAISAFSQIITYYKDIDVEINRTNNRWIEAKDGEWVEQYENGRVQIKGEIKSNLKEGKWSQWYENGQLMEQTNYSRGSRTGEFRAWYESGIRRWEGTFWAGKRNGEWTHFYKNGQMAQSGNYKNGQYCGIWLCWDQESGQPSACPVEWGFEQSGCLPAENGVTCRSCSKAVKDK